jgi:hypothetical protein
MALNKLKTIPDSSFVYLFEGLASIRKSFLKTEKENKEKLIKAITEEKLEKLRQAKIEDA